MPKPDKRPVVTSSWSSQLSDENAPFTVAIFQHNYSNRRHIGSDHIASALPGVAPIMEHSREMMMLLDATLKVIPASTSTRALRGQITNVLARINADFKEQRQ